jgi:hypothetical protein
MPAGKVVSLKVAPAQSAILCFDVSGMIGQAGVQLGQPVTAFNFAAIYANLGSTVAGSPDRLVYDSAAIAADPAVAASTLMALRAEPRKALLDKAIGARQNAYYQKYANQTQIIALQRTFYDPANRDSKYGRLGALRNLAQLQENLLMGAYQADGRTGVVKHTTSSLNSVTQTNGKSVTTGNSNGWTKSSGQSHQENTGSAVHYTHGVNAKGALTPTGTEQEDFSPAVQSFASGNTTLGGASSGLACNSGNANVQQTIMNTDYAYRVPVAEAPAQNHRSQISLMDEQFNAFMFLQNLPHLEQVFANELQAIDLDVKRLQVAYLDTILMSPIDGIVTGIYKQIGEGVKAGEAAIRVESNRAVLLVGTLIYRGMISVGSNATVTSTLFSNPPGSAETVINGTIVAAQGHPREDDWWDVVISCDNVDANGNPILPLRYSFDFDDTSIVIA